MKLCALRIFLTVALLSAVFAVPTPVSAHDKDVGAAIAGGIIGLAAGAALSSHHHHDKVIYYPGYAPPYPPGGYGPYYDQSFSPNPGVICYPAHRACYRADGSFAPVWTSRIYGY